MASLIPMHSQQLIDAQFDRAVEIVQSLPKTGPIQTTYEDKLTMYSLYKQATVGNVKSPRPGIWDMLGRAKWDAWAKHKDLDPYEAKWLYVDAMLKVLRKYSDKTLAKDLIQELESYGGDPSNIVMSGELSISRGSESSGSTKSDDDIPLRSRYQAQPVSPELHEPDTPQGAVKDVSETNSEDETDEPPAPGLYNRPLSSISSHRYRTPMAGSMISPPPMSSATVQQPSGFETPSAFGGPQGTSYPLSAYPTQGPSDQLSGSSRDIAPAPNAHPTSPGFQSQSQQFGGRLYGAPIRPASRSNLERAIENVQAHLAALTERLESLESVSPHPHRSHTSLPIQTSSPRYRGRGGGSPTDDRRDYELDLNDLGMWSLVLSPVTRVGSTIRQVGRFFATSEHSPTLIVVRRLCLDMSFIFCVLWIVRFFWRKTGVRRREVKIALKILGRAIIGRQQERAMAERGV